MSARFLNWSHHANKTTDHLLNDIRGYARSQQFNLALLKCPHEWTTLAKMELDRRRAMFLHSLPDSLLVSIASGSLDITLLAKHVGR